MSDFLTRLAARALQQTPVLQPLVPAWRSPLEWVDEIEAEIEPPMRRSAMTAPPRAGLGMDQSLTVANPAVAIATTPAVVEHARSPGVLTVPKAEPAAVPVPASSLRNVMTP